MRHFGVKGETMESGKIIRTRRIARVSWILLTVFFMGIPSFAHADTKEILLKFHPYITAEEEYSTNIFLSPNATKMDDWITTATPGLRFSHTQAGGYGIDLDVSGGYTYYAKNHDFSFWSPEGRLNAWYAVTRSLTFRLRDYLIRSDAARESRFDDAYLYNDQNQYIADTQPGQYVLSTQRGVHAIYLRNVVEPMMEYRFGRENLASLLYRNNIYRNKNPEFEDSTENTINPLLNYWFDIRNGITLEGDLTYGHFEVSQNLKSYEGRARYTHRVNPKLSFFGEYIFLHEDFQNGEDSENPDDYVHNPSLGMEYKFSPTLTGRLEGGYYWQLVGGDTASRGPSFNVALLQTGPKISYTLVAEGGYTRDYFTSENLGFEKYYRTYGTFDYRLTPRMDVRLTGSMERVLYGAEDDNRKDWIWDGRVTVSYQLFRWLSVALEGRHMESHSNVELNSYSEYSGIFRISATLNP